MDRKDTAEAAVLRGVEEAISDFCERIDAGVNTRFSSRY